MYPLEQRQSRLKYIQHKHSVKDRVDALGNLIEFKLSFEEWYKIWIDSGHWLERGCRKGNYVMSRLNDVGNYQVGNVYIKPMEENIREGHNGLTASNLCKQRSKEANSKSIKTPDGIFNSVKDAAIFYKISRKQFTNKVKKHPEEYYFA